MFFKIFDLLLSLQIIPSSSLFPRTSFVGLICRIFMQDIHIHVRTYDDMRVSLKEEEIPRSSCCAYTVYVQGGRHISPLYFKWERDAALTWASLNERKKKIWRMIWWDFFSLSLFAFGKLNFFMALLSFGYGMERCCCVYVWDGIRIFIFIIYITKKERLESWPENRRPSIFLNFAKHNFSFIIETKKGIVSTPSKSHTFVIFSNSKILVGQKERRADNVGKIGSNGSPKMYSAFATRPFFAPRKRNDGRDLRKRILFRCKTTL